MSDRKNNRFIYLRLTKLASKILARWSRIAVSLAFLTIFSGIFLSPSRAGSPPPASPVSWERIEELGRPLILGKPDGSALRMRVGSTGGPILSIASNEFRERLERNFELNILLDEDSSQGPGTETGFLFVAAGLADPVLDPVREQLRQVALPPQGFVLQQVFLDGRPGLVCYGGGPLGARYGLIEILRRLQIESNGIFLDVAFLREAPRFSFREVYINLSAHQMNNYNPAVITGDPEFDWDVAEWKRFIDMISFFRYNWLELWLPPHLFRLEALEGGPPYDRFTRIMNEVASYARDRGVKLDMLIPVNCTVGTGSLFNEIPFWAKHNMPAYRYLCPKIPQEHEAILKLWSHWIQSLPQVAAWSFFPGDPGGCMANGCDPTTAVDLYIELAHLVKKINPGARPIAHLWQWFGWGKTFLTPSMDQIERGQPQVDRIDLGNDYLIQHLQKFPADTQFVLNPGDYAFRTPLAPKRAEKYIRQLSRHAPVTTWTYFVTEGEGWINHAYRIPEILEARRREDELPVSGGISYTMTPGLNLLNLFANAEAFWNPEISEDQIVQSYTEGVFGVENLALQNIFPTYQVAPMVGYTFSGAPNWSPDYARLRSVMSQNLNKLQSAKPPKINRFVTMMEPDEYLEELQYFARLYLKLATLAELIEEAKIRLADHSGQQATGEDSFRISDLKQAAAQEAGGDEVPGRKSFRELYRQIIELEPEEIRERYREKHYSVFTAHPNEFTPLVPHLIDGFFLAFGYDFLEKTGKHTEAH